MMKQIDKWRFARILSAFFNCEKCTFEIFNFFFNQIIFFLLVRLGTQSSCAIMDKAVTVEKVEY